MIDGLTVEVEVLLWRRLQKLSLNLVYLALGILVGPRVREGEVNRFTWRSREHVLEAHNELVVVVDEVLHFREDSTPLRLLLLSIGASTEDWLETVSIQLSLVVQILKSER